MDHWEPWAKLGLFSNSICVCVCVCVCVHDLSWVSNMRTCHIQMGIKVIVIPPLLSGKESACDAEDTRDPGSISGWGRSPGKGHGAHYSVLAWRIPWTEDLGRIQSTRLQRVWHDWSNWAWVGITDLLPKKAKPGECTFFWNRSQNLQAADNWQKQEWIANVLYFSMMINGRRRKRGNPHLPVHLTSSKNVHL